MDVVLPTPPFWFATAITRAGPCSANGAGSGTIKRCLPTEAAALTGSSSSCGSERGAKGRGVCMPGSGLSRASFPRTFRAD